MVSSRIIFWDEIVKERIPKRNFPNEWVKIVHIPDGDYLIKINYKKIRLKTPKNV